MKKVEKKQKEVTDIKHALSELSIEPGEINEFLQQIASSPITEKQKAEKILLRPSIELKDLVTNVSSIREKLDNYPVESTEQASIQIKYGTYIQKEKDLVEKMSQMEELQIPESFDYRKLVSLGNEAREKLSRIRPATLGQASRISGINPSDVQILMVFMGR